MPLLRLAGLPADPLSFWQSIHRNPRNGFYLGSGAGSENDHLIHMSAAEPKKILSGRRDGIDTLEQILNELKTPSLPAGFDAPRFVGVIGFDAGRLFDEAIGRFSQRPDPLGFPVMHFGDYRSVVKLDVRQGSTTVFAEGPRDARRIVSCLRRLDRKKAGRHLGMRRIRFSHPSLAQFSEKVAAAKAAIARGDIYQANLSMRFAGNYSGTPVELYRHLCTVNPSPYACLIKQEGSWIVSCSPELLLSVRGREAATRPIAGTRLRGKTTRLDRLKRGQLLLSPKERAEHIMLVDLERNDLGRVCVPGSVHVTEKTAVERYSHVMHIVSQVRGTLARKKTSIDALRALFPGGTITGCPKIKSIEIIQDLERISRGPFFGSAGYVAWNGDAVFNILIRTALIQAKRIYIQAGAGIVADSEPRREYREAVAKAQALLDAVAAA